MFRKTIGKPFAIFSDVFRLLNYSDRRLTLLVLLATIGETALALGSLFAIKVLIDSISAGSGVQDVGTYVTPMLAIVLLLVMARLLQSVAGYLKQKQSLLVADVVNGEIQRRTIAVDQSFFDGAQYFDALERAREAGPQRPAQVVSNAIAALRSVILVSGVGIVLAGLDYRILIGIFIALALGLAVQLNSTSAQFHWLKRRIQLERRTAYLDWLLTSEWFSKELRLFNAGDMFRTKYRDLREIIRREQLTIEWLRTKREAMIAMIAGAVFVWSALMLINSVATGSGTIGDLVLFVILFQRAEAAGRQGIQSLSRLYDDQLFLNQLFTFLRIEPEIVPPKNPAPIPQTLHEGVRMHDVTFKYPRSQEPVLKGISIHIPPGKFVALVGGNGSGKTTLIKVLCRLYDPASGRVTLDGTDVRTLQPEDYRREFGVVFQDFVRYAESASENIRLGDVRISDDDARIQEAARIAGADEFLQRLPQGYDTMLARVFDDGEELSGGQWQKVALARAFFPSARFLILDEPTSSIDAGAEEELFRNFKKRIGDRGALVISHRLSTIRRADYTYVLDDGKIVEEGTHEQLLSEKSRYFRMFEAQISSNTQIEPNS
ncbi:MAG: ABC transporter ATP-binding protein [Pseudomonadota bacterium]